MNKPKLKLGDIAMYRGEPVYFIKNKPHYSLDRKVDYREVISILPDGPPWRYLICGFGEPIAERDLTKIETNLT